VLQVVAVCYRLLQCAAVRFSALQRVVLCCSELQYKCCIVLQCVTECCNVFAICCNVLQCVLQCVL